MKRFNRTIAIVIAIYLAIMLAVVIFLYHERDNTTRYYMVEVNRIYNSLSNSEDLDKLSLDSYYTITDVSFLPKSETDSEVVSDFYDESNTNVLYKYWGENEGVLRFSYDDNNNLFLRTILVTILAFIFLLLITVAVLIYVKRKIINPFHRMSKISFELSKGHFQGQVQEEKSKYWGNFIWGVGMLRDTIATSKKKELELIKEKKQLLLSLSHDIKTPLNTIKLYAQAIEKEAYSTKEQNLNAAKQINTKTIEIEGYIEDIMKHSREDILDIEVKKGEFYLSELVSEITGVYNEIFESRNITHKLGNYQDCLLSGDIDRSREVLENVIENALKYGDGYKIDMIFHTEGNVQIIKVINSGEIVKDNEKLHLFESFYRGSNAAGKQGSGLGLYICKEIMRNMNGDIYAEQLDTGMSFSVIFEKP
ncbi:MAG: sensor histidine kinase [Suipraeoptans sp.]